MARYTLQMDDLEISMYLGLHDFEKQTPQRVIIAATIETEIESYAERGFYDYDDFARFLRGFENTHVETQEELVETIRTFLMSSDKVVDAVVHTRKPDIYDDAASVGLIYGQARSADGKLPHVVQLDELEITMFLGIHDYEKATPQRVLVSSTIVTDIDGYEAGGFYDYDILVDFIRGFDGASIETQEELLGRIHDFIMSSDMVTDALVHTRKPDIYSDAKSIGIIAGSLPFPYRQTMVAMPPVEKMGRLHAVKAA